MSIEPKLLKPKITSISTENNVANTKSQKTAVRENKTPFKCNLCNTNFSHKKLDNFLGKSNFDFWIKIKDFEKCVL